MSVTGAKARKAIVLLGIVLLPVAVAFLSGHISESAENRVITSNVPTPPIVREPVESLSLPCLTQELIEKIRARKSIDAAFNGCAGELARVLGPEFAHLETPDFKAIFAMLVAHNMAPYGTSHALELDALLKEPVLDCDNYMLLTAYLARDGMALVGFDGKASVGNHAQIFYSREKIGLLLDPTVALVALADYESVVVAGKPVAAKSIRLFYRGDELIPLISFVTFALQNGRYREAHLMYFYQSVEHFRRREILTAPVPAAVYRRAGQTQSSRQ